MKCSECRAIDDCKHAFGVYWHVKSNGGDGCGNPFGGWPEGWQEKVKKTAAVKASDDMTENWTERFLNFGTTKTRRVK